MLHTSTPSTTSSISTVVLLVLASFFLLLIYIFLNDSRSQTTSMRCCNNKLRFKKQTCRCIFSPSRFLRQKTPPLFQVHSIVNLFSFHITESFWFLGRGMNRRYHLASLEINFKYLRIPFFRGFVYLGLPFDGTTHSLT